MMRELVAPSSPDAVSLRLPMIIGVTTAAVAIVAVSSHWFVAVLGAAAILALSAMQSEWFLLLIIALLPLNWVLKADLPVRDLMVVVRILVVSGFCIGRLWRRSLHLRHILETSLTRAALLFAFVAVLSASLPRGGFSHESVRELSRLVSYLGFYLLICLWVNSVARVRRIVLVLLASTIVVSVFAVWQELVGGFTSPWLYFNPPSEFTIDWNGRAPSFFPYSNTLAGYLNLILPFAVACVALGRGKWKARGAWAVGVGFLGLVCTQSIGGLVSFGCVLVLAILCFTDGWRMKCFLLLGLLIVALGLYVEREAINPAHLGEAFSYDGMARLFMWNAAWELFRSSPIMGIGWGNFLASYATDPSLSWVTPQVLYANNLYLDLLAGMGLVGFATFSVFVAIAVGRARVAFKLASTFLDKALGFGILGALLASLVHGFIDDVIVSSPQAATTWWMMLALLVASTSLQTSSEARGEQVSSSQSVNVFLRATG